MFYSQILREVVEDLSKKYPFGFRRELIDDIVRSYLQIVIRQIVANGKGSLIHFGSFYLKERDARKYRAPQGQIVYSPPKFYVRFKPSKMLKDKLGELNEQQAAKKTAAITKTKKLTTPRKPKSPPPPVKDTASRRRAK